MPVTQALLADGRKMGALSPGAVAFPVASGLLLSQEPTPSAIIRPQQEKPERKGAQSLEQPCSSADSE